MKLPGRTPILVEFDSDEYNALKKSADESKISMTLIVRDLIREHLMKDALISAGLGLTKRLVKWADGEKQPVVVHLQDSEYKFLTDYSGTKSMSMTFVIRNLVRKNIMGVKELPQE